MAPPSNDKMKMVKMNPMDHRKQKTNFYKLKWHRFSGAGNSFFIALIDKPMGKIIKKERQKVTQFVALVCGSFVNFKTDGVIFLERIEKKRFRWYFYNRDGSTAEMCGNAARCVSHFTFSVLKIREKNINLQTAAGRVWLFNKNSDHQFSIRLGPAKILKEDLKVKVRGQIISGTFANTGVPHFVIKLQSQSPKLKALAAKLRNSIEVFGKAGTNVTFLRVIDSHNAEAVTFERGVEDFTPSCGTGAAAAAVVLRNLYHHSDQVRIKMPGGALTLSGPTNGFVLAGPTRQEFSLRFKELE